MATIEKTNLSSCFVYLLDAKNNITTTLRITVTILEALAEKSMDPIIETKTANGYKRVIRELLLNFPNDSMLKKAPAMGMINKTFDNEMPGITGKKSSGIKNKYNANEAINTDGL